MLNELIGLLGLKKEATEADVIAHVKQMTIDLHGKMGYASASVVQKLIHDGLLKENYATNSYYMEVSKDWLKQYLEHGR